MLKYGVAGSLYAMSVLRNVFNDDYQRMRNVKIELSGIDTKLKFK